MAQKSEIKSAIDTQLDVAIDIVAAARELNAIRLQLEGEGRAQEAAQLRGSIERLVQLSDRLTNSAKFAGRAWLEGVRAGW